MARAQEEKYEGVKVSQTEAPTPGESPQLEAGGSGKALLTKTAPDRERVLETTREILTCIHTLHLRLCTRWGAFERWTRLWLEPSWPSLRDYN